VFELKTGDRVKKILTLLCLAQFMLIVDVTVVNVAMPTIGADLGLGRGGLAWVVAAYSLCFGGLLLLGGRLADAVGPRRTLLAGLALFTAASATAGMAQDGAMLIGARAAQGVGAALLSPAALAILTTVFDGPARTRALGVWAALGGTGAASGVLLGGALTSGPGWRWVFAVNVPVGVALLAAVPRVVPAIAGRRGGGVDLPGALAVTAGAGLLLYGLIRAGDDGWSDPAALACLAAAAVAVALFAVRERTARTPLVPPRLLAQRDLAAGAAVMLAGSALLIAAFFLCSLYLQDVRHYSPWRTGLAFLPVALATIAGAHTGVRMLGRVGRRPVGMAAFAVAAAGAALLSRLPAGGSVLLRLEPGFVLLAAGLGAGFVCATTTAMGGSAGQHHAGLVSGIVNTCHELGSALGLAGVAAAGGFRAAFTAGAVLALLVAVAAARLLPAGRPDLDPDRPAFAH
jgi:EmrB/QacA subfamily drug resistance transporter